MRHGFPDSSVGKEFACNAGDLGSIPGSGRSAGEGIGYPLQYSWASLVAQLVKNPSAMRETWVPFPGLGRSHEPSAGYKLSLFLCSIPTHGVRASLVAQWVENLPAGQETQEIQV